MGVHWVGRGKLTYRGTPGPRLNVQQQTSAPEICIDIFWKKLYPKEIRHLCLKVKFTHFVSVCSSLSKYCQRSGSNDEKLYGYVIRHKREIWKIHFIFKTPTATNCILMKPQILINCSKNFEICTKKCCTAYGLAGRRMWFKVVSKIAELKLI